jgi:hypothetical protein
MKDPGIVLDRIRDFLADPAGYVRGAVNVTP